MEDLIDVQYKEGCDEETLNYYEKENEEILKEIENFDKEEIICLYDNVMSGWLMIDNSKIEHKTCLFYYYILLK